MNFVLKFKNSGANRLVGTAIIVPAMCYIHIEKSVEGHYYQVQIIFTGQTLTILHDKPLQLSPPEASRRER